MDALASLVLFLIGLGALVFFIWSLVWVYEDAQNRKNMGCLICILVFLTWPLGLLLWVLLRPENDYYQ